MAQLSRIQPAALGNSGVELGMRNRLINGGMAFDQRNAGASATQGTSNAYCLDRWLTVGSQASKFTVQQNTVDAPVANGFATCAKITSSSAYTVGASEIFFFIQKIEGFNQTDIGWGTSGAQPVTLSFLVRSSLTGTFGGCLINGPETYTFPFSYTINNANTWETKTITIPAQTAGAWSNNSNGVGIQLVFSMGCGSSLQAAGNTWTTGSKYAPTGATNVVGTNAATWYITGVQLEKGSNATPFEFRQYGAELALCQRYYQGYTYSNGSRICMGFARSSAIVDGLFQFPVMRAAPTVSLPPLGNGAGQGTYVTNAFGYPGMTGSLSAVSVNTSSFVIFQSGDSGFTTGQSSIFYSSSGCSLSLSAEL